MNSILQEPQFANGYQRNFAFGTVDVNTGEFTVYDNDNLTLAEGPYAAMSSASIPVVF